MFWKRNGKTAAVAVPPVTTEHLTREEDLVLNVNIGANDQGLPPVDVRVFGFGTSDARLRAAFASQVMSVTLEGDLPAFEKTNTLVVEAFKAANAADHIPAFEALWTKEEERLRARWAEIAAEGLSPEKVMLGTDYRTVSPVIVYCTTGLVNRIRHSNRADKDVWGVRRKADGKIEHVASYHNLTFKEPTQENLVGLTQLSGHEKLELLSGVNAAAYKVLRGSFDQYRKRVENFRAVDQTDLVVDGSDVYYANKQSGILSVYTSHNPPNFYCRLNGAKPNTGIRVELSGSKDKGRALVLERNVTNERRFADRTTLDHWVREVIEMILAVDEVVPLEIIGQANANPFDGVHPILKGLTVPPRHQAFIGAILGRAYEKAAKSADRWAARRAKQADKEESLSDLAKTVVDGAIFGKIDRRKVLDTESYCWSYGNTTKLFQVKTVSAPGTRRKRQMQCFSGGINPRPVTTKQLARLPQLTAHEALHLAHEFQFDGSRAQIEMAFHLSLHLKPGSENPFLNAQINEITISEASNLRLAYVEARSYRAMAISGEKVKFNFMEDVLPKTFAGVIVLLLLDKLEVYVRPALYGRGASAPEDQRAALEDALRSQAPALGFNTDTVIGHFSDEWAKLTKRYGS